MSALAAPKAFEDARALAPQLDRALLGVDVVIESSCFCRMGEARTR